MLNIASIINKNDPTLHCGIVGIGVGEYAFDEVVEVLRLYESYINIIALRNKTHMVDS